MDYNRARDDRDSRGSSSRMSYGRDRPPTAPIRFGRDSPPPPIPQRPGFTSLSNGTSSTSSNSSIPYQSIPLRPTGPQRYSDNPSPNLPSTSTSSSTIASTSGGTNYYRSESINGSSSQLPPRPTQRYRSPRPTSPPSLNNPPREREREWESNPNGRRSRESSRGWERDERRDTRDDYPRNGAWREGEREMSWDGRDRERDRDRGGERDRSDRGRSYDSDNGRRGFEIPYRQRADSRKRSRDSSDEEDREVDSYRPIRPPSPQEWRRNSSNTLSRRPSESSNGHPHPRFLDDSRDGLPRRPQSPESMSYDGPRRTSAPQLLRDRDHPSPRRQRSFSPGEISEGIPPRSPTPPRPGSPDYQQQSMPIKILGQRIPGALEARLKVLPTEILSHPPERQSNPTPLRPTPNGNPMVFLSREQSIAHSAALIAQLIESRPTLPLTGTPIPRLTQIQSNLSSFDSKPRPQQAVLQQQSSQFYSQPPQRYSQSYTEPLPSITTDQNTTSFDDQTSTPEGSPIRAHKTLPNQQVQVNGNASTVGQKIPVMPQMIEYVRPGQNVSFAPPTKIITNGVSHQIPSVLLPAPAQQQQQQQQQHQQQQRISQVLPGHPQHQFGNSHQPQTTHVTHQSLQSRQPLPPFQSFPPHQSQAYSSNPPQPQSQPMPQNNLIQQYQSQQPTPYIRPQGTPIPSTQPSTFKSITTYKNNYPPTAPLVKTLPPPLPTKFVSTATPIRSIPKSAIISTPMKDVLVSKLPSVLTPIPSSLPPTIPSVSQESKVVSEPIKIDSNAMDIDLVVSKVAEAVSAAVAIPMEVSPPPLSPPHPRSPSPPISPPRDFTSILSNIIIANEEDSGHVNELMELNRAKTEKERSSAGVLRDLSDDHDFFNVSAESHERLRPFLLESFENRDAKRAERILQLRGEYKIMNEDWKAHCRRLEKIKDRIHRRNQPPTTVPTTPSIDPSSGLPFYPEPTTPGPSIVGGRANRRNTNAAFGYGDAVRSEAEFLEILASLETADLRDPNVRATRTAAIVPDMVVDDSERRELLALDDNRRLVEDPVEFYSLQQPLDLWTEDEVQIFCKRFTQHPKQFGKISSELPEKTTAQCVLFYYRMKTTIDFRSLSDRRGRDGRRRNKNLRRKVDLDGTGGKKGASLISNLKRARADDRDEDDDSPPPETPYQLERNNRYVPESPSVFQPPESTSRPAALPDAFDDYNNSLHNPQFPTPSNNYTPSIVKRTKSTKVPSSKSLLPSDNTLEAAEALSGMSDVNAIGSPAEIAEGKAAARRKASTSSYWSVGERNEFVRLLGIHGKEWDKLAKGLINKTSTQCRNWFQNHQKELNLALVAKNADPAGDIAEGDESGRDFTVPLGVPLSESLNAVPRAGFFVPDGALRVKSAPADATQLGMKIRNILNDDTPDEEIPVTDSRDDWFGAVGSGQGGNRAAVANGAVGDNGSVTTDDESDALPKKKQSLNINRSPPRRQESFNNNSRPVARYSNPSYGGSESRSMDTSRFDEEVARQQYYSSYGTQSQQSQQQSQPRYEPQQQQQSLHQQQQQQQQQQQRPSWQPNPFPTYPSYNNSSNFQVQQSPPDRNYYSNQPQRDQQQQPQPQPNRTDYFNSRPPPPAPLNQMGKLIPQANQYNNYRPPPPTNSNSYPNNNNNVGAPPRQQQSPTQQQPNNNHWSR